MSASVSEHMAFADPSGPERVFVALGANLGDPAAQLLAAFARLDALGSRPARRSSLWESAPLDCPPGSPRFVNAAAEVFPRPGDSPESWLDALQAVEREFGRRPKVVMNEARALDLDLIVWGRRRLATDRLVLPHPRALERGFVLGPMAELAADLPWPGLGGTVAEFLRRLPADPALRRL